MHKSIYTKEQKELVEKLIKARKEAGLTQIQVAKALKVTQSHISKIEAGQRKIDIVLIKTLSKIYQKDLSTFIT